MFLCTPPKNFSVPRENFFYGVVKIEGRRSEENSTLRPCHFRRLKVYYLNQKPNLTVQKNEAPKSA